MTDHITIVGNIATVPERRTTSGGIPVASFRVASPRRHRDQSGTWVDDEPNWYAVSAFRQLAEHALASFRKGERVIVTGALTLRKWESANSKGMDAEIEASACGHDLLWGTSAFSRTGTSPSATPAADPASEWAVDVHASEFSTTSV